MSIKLFSDGELINEEKNWEEDWNNIRSEHDGDERQLEFNFENNKLEFCFEE